MRRRLSLRPVRSALRAWSRDSPSEIKAASAGQRGSERSKAGSGSMKKQPFTVADYLLTRLKQLNVTEVFQIPGDYVKHFTQALENFPGVNAIGAINELDAAYAADAYGRTRGLAAVSLQYGVSTFSALNAIAGAYVEFSPVVVISATPGADDRQITKMYDVLFHHSTGNLDCDRA